ncbi:MAG: XRE family transcriptional regulator [Novosphingobium sp.]
MPELSPVDSATYRDAVATIVSRIQRAHSLSDAQLAKRVGCSAGTIKNARTGATNLDAVTLANIERTFGPGAIDPFLALGHVRALPLTIEKLEQHPTLAIVEALHRLIETQTPGSDGGTKITSRELLSILKELRDARSAFDALILIADPALGSEEVSFRDKAVKRLAIVHTQGDTIADARIVGGPERAGD